MDNSVNTQLRQVLVSLPREQLPITYRQLAELLGLQPPGTIQRVALALEATMREDAEQGRPFIAALVVSRRDSLPARGFFDLAVALGRFPADPTRHADVYRQELNQVLNQVLSE